MELELIAVRIKDGIFVGNVTAAEDGEFLSMNKITHIVNCTGGEVGNVFEEFPEFKYISFPWKDPPGSVCTTILFDPSDEKINRAVRFIDEALDSGNCVLVHSYYGISRSPTLVAAYLMIKYNWKLESALSFLRLSHPDILIKPHFLRQLRLFAKRHPIRYDIFDKEVDDSDFALDNEQWMLRNTFLNGMCTEEQEANKLYKECVTKIDLGTCKHAERKKVHVSYIDSPRHKHSDRAKSSLVVNPKSVSHMDPYSYRALANFAGSQGLVALSSEKPSISIMSRSTSPCLRRLETGAAADRSGSLKLLRTTLEHKGSDSSQSTPLNFTRSNSTQLSLLRSSVDENKNSQVAAPEKPEEPLQITTNGSFGKGTNYDRLTPPKNNVASHNSPYAKLTPKHIYRKGSPLPIQKDPPSITSPPKHSLSVPARLSRNDSPSAADMNATNAHAATYDGINLTSLMPHSSNPPSSPTMRSSSTITRSSSFDYVCIAPQRVKPSTKAGQKLNPPPSNRPMIRRHRSPSAPIPEALTKSRSPCSKPDSAQSHPSPKSSRKKVNEATLNQHASSSTEAFKSVTANGMLASASSQSMISKKTPNLSAPFSGTVRGDTLTPLLSRRK